jgi:NitT/TauT family transport system permease protein
MAHHLLILPLAAMPESFSNAAVEALPHLSKVRQPARRSWLEFGNELDFPTRLSLGVLAWIVFLATWHWVSTSGLADPTLLPGPLRVAKSWITLFAERDFAADVMQSVKRIFFSYGIALTIALPLGILMGAFSPVGVFFNALVSPFRYLPAPSFVPLLLMWLGTGDGQKVALLVIGVVFFLISLFMDHTRNVPRELVECARTLGASRKKVVLNVLLPSALPHYLDTARQMPPMASAR